MSYSLRLTKRAQVLIIVLIAFFVAGVAGFSVWYVNNQDNQVGVDDSDAGEWECGKSCPTGYSPECLPNAECQKQGSQLCRCKKDTNPTQPGDTERCKPLCASNPCTLGCIGVPDSGCGDASSCRADENGCIHADFWCSGRSHSGCNEAHGSYLPGGQPTPLECVTVQKDVACAPTADNGNPGGSAKVIYYGDATPEIPGTPTSCTEGTGCNPDDLDWNCANIQSYMDRADCTKIAGWACDPTDFNRPVEIHVYDGTKYITKTTANLQRTDIASKCGGTSAHGFDIPMPAVLLDGKKHDINTYVIALDGSGVNPKIPPSPKSFDAATCNAPPTCNAITVSSDKVENGDTVTLTTTTSDTNGATDIAKVELFWSRVLPDAKYCGTQWNKIGAATNSGNNNWSLNWKVAGIPTTGGIVIAGNVHDKASAWCTGNPSGKCSTTATACKNCSLTVGIDTPICNSLSVSGGAVQNGSTVTINLAVTDSPNVTEIPLYWVASNEAQSYCTAADHVAIGNATKGTGGAWSYTWNVSGIPDSGSIEIFADVKGASTTFCSGNPSGSCGSSTISCPTCNQSVTVNIPQCGGSCTTDEQCDGSLSCVSGMCRNPICTEEEDCMCDIPVTGLFDNTLAKVGAGLLLVSVSLGYMLFDGFDRLVINKYSEAQEAVSEEGRHKRKRKDFEDRWDD